MRGPLLWGGPVLAAAIVGSIALRAAAEEVVADKTSEGWIVSLGASVDYGSKYDGARALGPHALPLVSFRRPNEPEKFSAPDDSFDYSLFETGRFSMGPAANLRAGRYRMSDSRLAGLDTIPPTIEGGLFAEYWPIENRFRTRVELRHGIRAHDGFIADFSADLVHRWGQFTLSGGPRLSVADGDFMNSYFGVSPAASRRNGLVMPFDPNPGIESVGYNVALGYRWSDAWTTTIYQTYGRLTDDAAKSPVVSRLGSRDQFAVGVSFTYSFKVDL